MLKQHLKSITAFAGLLLAMVSCTSNYRIDGVVETFGYEGRELSLIEFLPFRTTKYDSCIVNHGRFQMKGKADTTRLVFLCKDDRPIIPLYIEKGHAKVRLLPTEMTVSGTHQNDLFYSFLILRPGLYCILPLFYQGIIVKPVFRITLGPVL